MKKLLSLISVLLLSQFGPAYAAPESGSLAEKDKRLSWAFTPDPDLPNVMILGDSISIGYTLKVRELLEGKANVFRPMSANGMRPQNCSGTSTGVARLDQWLAGKEWALIHFNWGLHDLKHVNKAGVHSKSNDPDGPTLTTVEEYRQNLAEMVIKLKATQAKLVFATTTPVTPGTLNPLRTPEAPVLYNAAALKVMKANGIRVNDLFSFCKPKLAEWQLPKNVHFKAVGSAEIAKEVVRVIGQELESDH